MHSTHIHRLSELAGIAFAVAMILAAIPGLADEFKLGAITVENPRSRATPGGAKVASGYLTIKNGGATDDRFVSATAQMAGRAEIHQMSMADGVMQMRHVAEGLNVPAGGSVTLEPNGYHLMLMDLKRPLKEGETFAGTLTFEKAGTLDVTFVVEGVGGASDEHHH